MAQGGASLDARVGARCQGVCAQPGVILTGLSIFRLLWTIFCESDASDADASDADKTVTNGAVLAKFVPALDGARWRKPGRKSCHKNKKCPSADRSVV